MKRRLAFALLAAAFTGDSFAADLPVTAISPAYYPGRLLPVEWTGLYFGVNAGYGWAKESSHTVFTGFTGGATTPAALGGSGIAATSGQGVTELGGTDVFGSSSPRGGIAGGQLGFNWQSGMIVFGAEVDAQWSGQQATASIVCTPDCTASSTVKIKSLTTGRARIGLAFDWILPYVTAGGALVNAEDNLALTVGGVTGNFQGLSGTSLGWAAGAGFDVALSSNLSARLEYLHIRADGLRLTGPIPGILGMGTASESAGYRDNILRVGLNYRFGPRGGPGVLERTVSPTAYAINYDFLPSVVLADKAKPAKQVQTTSPPIVTADAAPETPSIALPSSSAKSADKAKPAKQVQTMSPPIVTADAAPETSSIALPSSSAKSGFKNFNEIGALEDTDTIALPKSSSKKRREKEEDESQRLKRIMAICAGC
jgi:opacity protein-like surface antigen